VHLGGVQVPSELLLPARLVGGRGVEDLGAAAVVEGDEQRDPFVASGLGLSPVDQLSELCGDALAAADEPHPHPLLVELGGLAVDPFGEHRHQAVHLLLGTAPVLGRERVDGELLDAELDGVSEALLDHVGARPVPLDHR
jgi:hypothetical protein